MKIVFNRYGTEFEINLDKLNAQMIKISLKEGNTTSGIFAIPKEMLNPIIKRLKELRK